MGPIITQTVLIDLSLIGGKYTDIFTQSASCVCSCFRKIRMSPWETKRHESEENKMLPVPFAYTSIDCFSFQTNQESLMIWAERNTYRCEPNSDKIFSMLPKRSQLKCASVRLSLWQIFSRRFGATFLHPQSSEDGKLVAQMLLFFFTKISFYIISIDYAPCNMWTTYSDIKSKWTVELLAWKVCPIIVLFWMACTTALVWGFNFNLARVKVKCI